MGNSRMDLLLRIIAMSLISRLLRTFSLDNMLGRKVRLLLNERLLLVLVISN